MNKQKTLHLEESLLGRKRVEEDSSNVPFISWVHESLAQNPA